MKRILLILKNDIKRRLKAPMTILVLLTIPLMMTGLMGIVFSPSENKLPAIKVLVTDKDKNIASKFLLGAFDQEQMKDMFQVTVVEENEGKRLIAKGKASALLVIPEGFTKQVLKAEPSEFLLIKNPSEQFLPDVVEEFMATFSVIVSGFVQVFEPELKMVNSLMDLPVENIEFAAMLPSMDQSKDKIVSLKQYLSPLLIQLKQEITGKKEETEEPGYNLFGAVLPGMAVMFLLFIIEIFIRDILNDREDGKLQRVMFAPVRTMEYIATRVFSGWVMGILVFFVLLMAGVLLFRIDWGNYLYLFLLVTVTSFWIASFFALMNSFFKNKNQAGAFTAPIILVFSMFGGSMIPIEQLPAAFHVFSKFTLNRWFVIGVNQTGEGIFPATAVGIIAVSGLLLFALAAQFLKKRMTV